jgi:hypothetical protein
MSLDFDLSCPYCKHEYFRINITHNLTEMADEAGLYAPLWHPNDGEKSEYPIYLTAKTMIEIVEKGYHDLRNRPVFFQQFNPPNGWGSYDHFVENVQKILEALQQYPESIPYASR